jgi:CysZ protein
VDADVNRVQQPTVGARSRSRAGAPGDFFAGAGFLMRGLGMYARNPGLMFLGLLPALITFALLVAAFVAVLFFADDAARWMTPYADGWDSGLRETARALITVAIVGVLAVLSIVLFTALTLLIGQPFYEAISKKVEDQLGGVPGGDINVSFWRTLPRTIGDNLRLIVRAAFFAVMLFALGLVPVVGQVTAAVLGALVGGTLLAVELTSVPFERRGLRLRDRRRMLRERRALSTGFGVATFVCFLIPLGAVVMMPAAVAGATLLSRRLFGLPE